MEGISGTLRQRKQATKVIRELDAFPKVPDSYQETTTSGGTVSIFTFLFIGILVISEFMYYRDTDIKYEYEVDKDAESKIRINIDMTVAMQCDDIGADVLDLSGTSLDTESYLNLEPSYFEMTKKQKAWWKVFQTIRASHEGYRTINNVLEIYSTSAKNTMPTYMPPSDTTDFAGRDFDACRVFGSVEVNKVAGNFHITAGKSIPHPRGHAHLSATVSDDAYNFSHRIDLLSFGEPMPGVINPLDGDLVITDKGYQMYQYYVKIVPTNIQTLKSKIKANQYSVTQRGREINHAQGSHGVPGIFFKYDLSSIMVRVKEERRAFDQFLIRLCGIIGGIFATSGMLHSFVSFLFDYTMAKKGAYTKLVNKENTHSPSQHESVDALLHEPSVTFGGESQVLTETSNVILS